MIVNDTARQDRRPSPTSARPPPSSSESTNKTDREPATDIQGALTVIGRRADGPGVVNLFRANLSGADLSGAILDGQTQLDQACGTDAKLPPGLTLKPCPAK